MPFRRLEGEAIVFFTELVLELATAASSRGSLEVLPLFRGLFVPGGASRFTVQYDPNPGSVAGRG